MVKKLRFFWIVVCLFSCMVQADWNLKAIYNNSDLPLTGAYRLKDGKKKATYVDKTVKSAKAKSVIMIGYQVPIDASKQGYLCFELLDKTQPFEKYELCVDSQRKNTILSKRFKAQKIVSNLSVSDDVTSDDSSIIARALLKKNEKLILSDQQPYDDEDKNAAFDVFIEGSRGLYTLKLSPVVE